MKSSVYFIDCPVLNVIKIGFTDGNPANRFNRIAATSPAPIVPLGVMPGTIQDERNLHSMFLDLWDHAEWFRGEDRLREHIAVVAKPWVVPPLKFVRKTRWMTDQLAYRDPRPVPPNLKRWGNKFKISVGKTSKTANEWSTDLGVHLQDMQDWIRGGAHEDVFGLFRSIETPLVDS